METTKRGPYTSAELAPSLTRALPTLALPLALPTLTKRNLDEWSHRVFVVQRKHGAWFKNADGSDRYVTKEDLRLLIGFEVNVGYKPRSAWERRIAKLWWGDFMNTVNALEQEQNAGIEALNQAHAQAGKA